MGKLLMLAGLTRGVYGTWRLQQILASLIGITIITIVIAVMIGAMFVAGLQALHTALLTSGFSAFLASVIVGLAMLLVLALLFFVAMLQLQRMRGLLRVNKTTNKACEIVNAFFDGLLNVR